MKTIMLCGGPKCCPSIEEDEEKGIMYIVDEEHKIAFNKEQRQKLCEYLCKRNKNEQSACKCASCNPE